MSYTNTIANTRTQTHSIVPETENKSVLEKITNAQGTGITGSALRKVAQFIGMDDLPAPTKAVVVPGILSVDFELEKQLWRSTYRNTSTLEETERSRRQLDLKVEEVRKAHAFVVSKSISTSLQSPRKSSNYDRPVSRKFLNYIRKNLTAMEEIERQRRKADSIGESAKRMLARETSIAIFSSIQQPTLRSTGHLVNEHRSGALSETLGLAGEVAMKKLIPAAELFAATAYQIGNFAARATYFFGGKAAVKAQDLGQKAAVQGQILGKEAVIKGQEIGQQALASGQVLGQQALASGQVLGQQALASGQVLGYKAVEEAQYLGNKAISGAQALGQKAQDLTAQAKETAYNTAAGAQNLANQTVEKTMDLTHQAQAAANNAIAGAQHLGDQAVDKAKELKDNVSTAVSEAWMPTLSWKQLAALEEAERVSRIAAQFGSNRFALALQTSTLVKDLILANDTHYNADSEPRRFYGTAILEETERLRRISSDKTSPVARMNAKRAAAIIMFYRQQTLGRVQRPATQGAVYAAPATQILVKEVQVQPVSPVRYQAAM